MSTTIKKNKTEEGEALLTHIMNDVKKEQQDLSKVLSAQQHRKYITKHSVGEGAMKYITRVNDKDTSRDIAMAVMLDPDKKESDPLRFIQEARITANLEHPNIVPVHDIGIDSFGNPYFTMKLIRGETFSSILTKLNVGVKDYVKKYDLTHLLQIFQKICDGIAFAHSKGVIHLDIKPDNIQVGDFGEVLVLDWGLAKTMQTMDESSTLSTDTIILNLENCKINLTLDGIVKGSLGYMAPEQAAGKNKYRDEKTDVYALGSILYSILTYLPPLSGNDIGEMLVATVSGDILPPSERIKDKVIPKALEAVVCKAMSVDHKKRYQSVTELKADMDAYIGGFATSAEHAGVWTLLMLLIKRNKKSAIVAGISFIFLTVILIFSFLSIKKREQEKIDIGKRVAPEFLNKSEMYMEIDKWDEALEAIDDAVKLNENLEGAWYQKGRLHLAKKEFKLAVRAFRKSGDVGNKDLKKFTERYYNSLLVTKDEKILANKAAGLPMEINKFDDEVVAAYLFKGINTTEALKARFRATARTLQRLNKRQKNLKLKDNKIDLHNNKITLSLNKYQDLYNIEPLRGLPITELDLSFTSVSDLSALEGMPLEKLIIENTKVENIEILQTLPLKILNINNTKVSDISFLENLPLESLEMQNLDISDAEVLRNMPLTKLNIIGTKIRSLKFLENNISLKELNCSETSINNLSSLSNVPIEKLNAYSANIKDLSPLYGKNMKELVLGSNNILNINALSGMPLTKLHLNNNPIRNISALGGMPLKELRLDNTQVDDISVVKGMKLENLNLSGCNVSNITALSFVPLKTLNLSNTDIEDIIDLRYLELKNLYLNGTKITNINPLRNMSLTHLDISSCKFINQIASVIYSCKDLTRFLFTKQYIDDKDLYRLATHKIILNNRNNELRFFKQFFKKHQEFKIPKQYLPPKPKKIIQRPISKGKKNTKIDKPKGKINKK